jgi:hypothetical protein
MDELQLIAVDGINVSDFLAREWGLLDIGLAMGKLQLTGENLG